jgi:serine/threonine protein kinase
MWSLGVTLYTMMYKDNPFQNPEEIVEMPLRFPYKLSEPLKSLVVGMLAKDPKTRLTLRQCLAHLWMTSMVPWSHKDRILSRYSLADFVER